MSDNTTQTNDTGEEDSGGLNTVQIGAIAAGAIAAWIIMVVIGCYCWCSSSKKKAQKSKSTLKSGKKQNSDEEAIIGVPKKGKSNCSLYLIYLPFFVKTLNFGSAMIWAQHLSSFLRL